MTVKGHECPPVINIYLASAEQMLHYCPRTPKQAMSLERSAAFTKQNLHNLHDTKTGHGLGKVSCLNQTKFTSFTTCQAEKMFIAKGRYNTQN